MTTVGAMPIDYENNYILFINTMCIKVQITSEAKIANISKIICLTIFYFV